MIYQLAKRDISWKLIPWFVVLLTGSVAALGSLSPTTVMPLGLMLIVGSTIPAQSRERETLFLLSLPITLQEIFIARVAAVLMLVWIPALTAAAMSLVLGRQGAAELLLVAGAATFTSIVCQCMAVREVRVPLWLMTMVISVLFTVCFTEMLLHPDVVQVPAAPVIAVSGIISAAVFWNTWNAIPLLRPGRVRAARKMARSVQIRRLRLPWWLFSWLSVWWLVILPFMSMTGPVTSGVLFLWSAPGAAGQKMLWLDSLPVSRRVIFAARVLPFLVVLSIGYIVGTYFGMAGQNRSIAVVSSQLWPPPSDVKPCARPNVVPPLDYWVRLKSGPAPVLQAPWGETFQPPVVRIYGISAYNPFAVGCGNSRRFFDWQYRKAGAAVEKVGPNRGPRLRVKPPVRIQTLTIIALLSLALLTFFPLFLNGWWRFRRLPGLVRWSFPGAGFVVLIGILILPAFDTGPLVMLKLGNLVQWISWMLPDDSRIAAGLMMLIPVGLYFAIERLFLASELLPAAGAVQATGNYN
jgi:hypothetical protein